MYHMSGPIVISSLYISRLPSFGCSVSGFTVGGGRRLRFGHTWGIFEADKRGDG